MVFDLEWILSHDDRFRYMLLNRMQTDCDYYLGYGNRCDGRLWARNEKKQIDYMKAIWNSFSDDKKPKWLTYDQILDYEAQMVKTGPDIA